MGPYLNTVSLKEKTKNQYNIGLVLYGGHPQVKTLKSVQDRFSFVCSSSISGNLYLFNFVTFWFIIKESDNNL